MKETQKQEIWKEDIMTHSWTILDLKIEGSMSQIVLWPEITSGW